MAQIVASKAKADRCNLRAIQSGGSKSNTILQSGEIWLVDTSNSEKIDGFGKFDSYIVGDGHSMAKNLVVYEIDDNKQDILTFDSAPTMGSTNPVTSGGVKSALDSKANADDTYTKSQINNLIVPVNSSIVITSTLPMPEVARANTIYRVPQEDLITHNVTGYIDYGFDGTNFVTLQEVSYEGNVFDDLTDLTGKTTYEKSTMIPSANIVEDLGYFTTTLVGKTYTNRMINSEGKCVQPSSGNGNRYIVVFDVSKQAGKTINVNSFYNYTSGYAWAVWNGDTTISSTGISQNTSTRTMDSGSTKGDFTVNINILEGDKYLAVANYQGHTATAVTNQFLVDAVTANQVSINETNSKIEGLEQEFQGLTSEIKLIDKELFADRSDLVDGKFINYESGNLDGNNHGGKNDSSIDHSSLGTKHKIQVTGLINVSDIDRLNYYFPYPNSSVNAAVLAAYKEDGTYDKTNSIPKVKNGIAKGTWVRSETTKFVKFTVYWNSGLSMFYATNPDTLGNRVNILSTNIDELEKWTGNNINAINRDRDSILTNVTNASTFNLLHFSDLHYDPENMQRIMDWYNAHPDYVDEILNTGDTVNSKYGTALGYGSVEGTDKILNVIGNHDIDNTGGGSYTHSGLDGYNTYIAPFVENWNVVQPDNASSGKCYYYKDYPTKNIRLIVLDSIVEYGESTAQQTWFKDVLDDAKEQNLHVIVACHWLKVNRIPVKTHFTPWALFGAAGSNGSVVIAQDVQEFINEGGKFICHLIGHSHTDFIGTLEYYPDQLCIMVGSANGSWNSEDAYHVTHGGGEVRIPGTRSQDSFNVYAINTEGHYIDVIKIGIDSNSYGQKKDYLRLDYLTKQEVYGNSDSKVVYNIAQDDNLTITAIPNTYHKLYVNNNATITLPTLDSYNTNKLVFYITTGLTPNVTFTSNSSIKFGYQQIRLEANKEYEFTCLWNGTKWLINKIEYING